MTSLPVSPVRLPGAVNKVCKHPESCRDAAERSGWRPWLRSVPTAWRLVLPGWARPLGPPTSGRGVGVRGRRSVFRFRWGGLRKAPISRLDVLLCSPPTWGPLAASQCFPEPGGARSPCVTALYSGDHGGLWRCGDPVLSCDELPAVVSVLVLWTVCPD